VALKERILERAPAVLAGGGKATVAEFAAAAGISRASFYRHFESREALLQALEVTPEPGARERILSAAIDMVGARGLTALSMDELADRAGVSRATLYRLFPGKAALFNALIHAFSPLDPVTKVLTDMQDEPPEVLMPELARTVYRTVYGGGENRLGLVRAIFFEISGLAPDTEEAAREFLANVARALAMYIVGQMEAGRLRRMHPLLALQSFVGPIFFHLVTKPVAERVLGMNFDGEKAVVELAEMWLRGMETEGSPRTPGEASEFVG
jgi:AcrR family transcriptional regulator